MPVSNDWDETSPLGTDLAASIDDFMRGLKLDIRERMELQHYWGDSLTTDGKHKSIDIPSAAEGASAAGEYVKIGRNTDGSGAAGHLRFVDKSGVVWYLWVDANGVLRRHSLPPTADGAVGDTDGTAVGVAAGSSLLIDILQVTEEAQFLGSSVVEIATIVPLRGHFEFQARGNSFIGSGIANASTPNTSTSPVAVDANGIWNKLTTTANATSNVLWQSAGDPDTNPACVASHDFDLRFVVIPGSNAKTRVWFGLTDLAQATEFGNTDTPSTCNAIVFRFGPNDSGWVGVCQDGASRTVSSTVGNFTPGTKTILRIRKSAGVVYFSIDDTGTGFGTEQAVSTHVPDTDLGLGMYMQVYATATDVVLGVRYIYVGRVSCSYGSVDLS